METSRGWKKIREDGGRHSRGVGRASGAAILPLVDKGCEVFGCFKKPFSRVVFELLQCHCKALGAVFANQALQF